jgi:aminoglycoside phosphotransferase family enzyme/predicted kinase
MTPSGVEIPATTLKDDLQRPAAFAEVAPSCHVSLIETHISWVFLLERDVFKVKKPVDLGFLNFRSIEQRRSACEEEVRLNARLAHGVYRGVVPVTRDLDGRCVVGGVGAVVDWAVHMVRLSDDDRADRLLARGDLSAEAVDRIAIRIAEFHRTARVDAKCAQFGCPPAIEANIVENFAQTAGVLSRYLSDVEASQIVHWQMAFVRGQRACLELRLERGRVCEGHGDLRLEHVYLPPGRAIDVLDCIEFSDRFRYGDVCADIGFLSMDLAAHGRVDLAELLLASYAREADDFDLYAVVDFYESYRAFVRGKVASILASDGDVDPATRQHAEAEARRYFLLALSSARPSVLKPALVAVGGVIASGKSSVARRLASEMSAPVIEADRTRKGLVGVDPLFPIADAAWAGAYDPAFTDRVYEEVLRRAAVVLGSGRPVVLDASFRSAAHRRAARDLARSHGVPFLLVECRASPDVCRQRLAARKLEPSVSDGREAIFDDFSSRFEPIAELPSIEHSVLDTTAPLSANIEPLRRLLDVWPRGLVG